MIVQQKRFNPYRVFSGLATTEEGAPSFETFPVSIPIGFSQALQLGTGRFRDIEGNVSIPIGFSQALQLHIPNDIPGLLTRVSIPIGFSQALQRYGD